MKKPPIHIENPTQVKKYTKAHIDYLINAQAEESVYLEFKAGEALDVTDAKKKEISKDVSAFANSDGGVVIYGLAEEAHKASEYAFVDGNVFSKEWLEQIINSKIKRRIPNLTIDVIRVGNKITQSIYVVKIPRSPEGPHMASDSRYYKRYNFESTQMEEYEVRDLFRRQAETNIKLSPIEFKGDVLERNKEGEVVVYRLHVVIDVQNVSHNIESTYKTILRIPRHVYDGSAQGQGLEKFFRKYQPDYALLNIPASTPLFPYEVNTLANFYLYVKQEHLKELSVYPLKVRFYYSNGIYERENYLDIKLKVDGRILKQTDFAGS
jgi:hypothetical protein